LKPLDAEQQARFALTRFECLIAGGASDQKCSEALLFLNRTLDSHYFTKIVHDLSCGGMYKRLVSLSGDGVVERPKTLETLVKTLSILSRNHADDEYAKDVFEVLTELLREHPAARDMILRDIEGNAITAVRAKLLFDLADDYRGQVEDLKALRRALVVAAIKGATPDDVTVIVSMVTAVADPAITSEICDFAAGEHRLAVCREEAAAAIKVGIDERTGLCSADFSVSVSKEAGDVVINLGDPADDSRNELTMEAVQAFQEMYEAKTLPDEEPEEFDEQQAFVFDFVRLFKEIIPKAIEDHLDEDPDNDDENPAKRCIVIMHGHHYVL
jgi:hypothetical protein